MSNDGVDRPETAKWDPGFTRQLTNWVGPVIKRYFRAEVRGLESMPKAGGALVVSNHSSGMFTPDVLILAPAFYDKFAFDRPVYTLAHYGVFIANVGDWLRRAGVIEATREIPPGHSDPVPSCWCSPAVTTTRTGRRSPKTSSTSVAEPATSGPPLKVVCRSYRWC